MTCASGVSAVIGLPELADAGWIDLLTVELAAQPGPQVVEREAIAAATRELAVTNMLRAEAKRQYESNRDLLDYVENA